MSDRFDAGYSDGRAGRPRYANRVLIDNVSFEEYNQGYQQGKQDRINEQNMYDYEYEGDTGD